nr:unnamed protein product [Haemonchus contortus]
MNVLPLLIDAYNLTDYTVTNTEVVSVDNTTLEILTTKMAKTTRRPRKRKTTRSPTAEDEGLPLGFIIAVGDTSSWSPCQDKITAAVPRRLDVSGPFKFSRIDMKGPDKRLANFGLHVAN